jgi:hypothetical protein
LLRGSDLLRVSWTQGQGRQLQNQGRPAHACMVRTGTYYTVQQQAQTCPAYLRLERWTSFWVWSRGIFRGLVHAINIKSVAADIALALFSVHFASTERRRARRMHDESSIMKRWLETS